MKRLLWSLVVLVALVAVPASAQLSLLGMKNSLVQFALRQISVPGELEITAEGVEEPDDGSTAIVGLAVADGQGVWLRAESLAVSWNPARILRGELDINSLTARGVQVERRPQPVAVKVKEDADIAKGERGLFDWPRSPITVRVAELALERVEIAGDVLARQSVAFDATGAFADEGDEQSLKLDLVRTDETQGRIVIDYLRDFAADTLGLTLKAEEAAGGLVTEMAGFPADSPTRIDLQASGPLIDWQISLSAETEGLYTVEGGARFANTEKLALSANLTVAPGPLASAELQTVLAPEARLTLRVAEDDAGLVQIDEGRIVSPELTAEATGTYDLGTGSADMKVTLAGGSGLAGLAEGVELAAIRFDGSLTGTADALAAKGLVSLDGLKTAPTDIARARLETSVTFGGGPIVFEVNGDTGGVRIDRLGPDLLGETTLAIAGRYEADALTLGAFGIESPLFRLSARGKADIAAATAALDYDFATEDLAPIARAYDVDAAGRAMVTGNAAGPFDAVRLSGEARFGALRFEREPLGEVRLDHDVTIGKTIGGRATVQADGSRFGPASAEGEFTLAGAALSLPKFSAAALGVAVAGRADVALATSLVTGEISVDAPDLATLSELAGAPVAGRLAGTLALRPEAGRQDADLDLTLTGFDGFDAAVDELRLTGRAEDALGDPRATLDVTLAGAVHPQASVAEGTLALVATTLLSAPAVEATFALGGVDAAGQARIGRLEGSATARDLTGEPEGKLDATLAEVEAAGFSAPEATLTASLDGKGNDAVALARVAVPRLDGDGLSVRRISLDARAEAPLTDAPRLDLALATGSVEAPPVTLDKLSATVKGPLAALALAGDTTGALGEDPLGMSLRAAADLSRPEITATVSKGEITLADAAARLRRPLKIAMAGGTTRFDAIDLDLPGGRVTGDAALHRDGMGGDLRLVLDDLAELERLAATPLRSGRLTLDAAFDTRPGSARATLRAEGQELGFDSALSDSTLGLIADAGWDGRRLSGDASISGPFGNPLSLAGMVAMRPSGGPLPQIPPTAPIAADIDWSGDIGELWALVPLPDHILDGTLELAAKLSGTINDPKLGGSVSLSNGQYQNLETGTILTDLSLNSRIEASGALALDLTGTDGGSGTVEATIALDAETIDLKARAAKAVLVRRDDIGAQVDADLAIKGPLLAPAVTGEVRVIRAELRLVNALPPSVADLGPVRVKGAPETPPDEDGAARNIPLDLRIFAPGQIFVRGRGLDSEWKMDLAITGTAATPVVKGRIDKLRGVLSFLGKDFTLSRGQIAFSGATPPDPDIAVSLEHENKDGLIGRINVTGRPSDLRIGFSSQPELPESEVLPQTLFGKSRQSLSPTEAVLLANALATLMDGSGGAVDRLRASVGIDVLRLEEDGDSVAVSVGKNVTEDVFVGAKQPIGGGSATIEVEVQVYKGVSVDAEMNEEKGSAIGFGWRYDF